MRHALLLLVLTSCVHLSHIPPQPRAEEDRERTVALIEASCDDGMTWTMYRGTGVVVSERHVLTAAHVVACASLPGVYATIDGRRWRMVVTREDHDVARLEIASAEYFHLDVPPPLIAPVSDDILVAYLLDGQDAAGIGQPESRWVAHMATHPGDSGAPVYDHEGALVGLVLAGDGRSTEITPLDQSWLEGT